MKIDCEQFLESVDELALLPPDRPLESDYQQHFDSCPDCQKALRMRQEEWLASLPATIGTDNSTLERIERRVVPSAVRGDENRTKATLNILRFVLAASVLVGLLSFLKATFLPTNEITDSQQDVEQIRALAEALEKLDDLEQAFAAPPLKFVSFLSANTPGETAGYLVFDQESNEAHFFGLDLQSDTDSTHFLWIVGNDQNVLSFAKIQLNSAGLGTSIVELANPNAAAEAILTLEATEEPKTPSQRIISRTSLDFLGTRESQEFAE